MLKIAIFNVICEFLQHAAGCCFAPNEPEECNLNLCFVLVSRWGTLVFLHGVLWFVSLDEVNPVPLMLLYYLYVCTWKEKAFISQYFYCLIFFSLFGNVLLNPAMLILYRQTK